MCIFHTQRMKITQPLHHNISLAMINVLSLHRLDSKWIFICTVSCPKEEKPNSSLALSVFVCPEGSSFFCWTPENAEVNQRQSRAASRLSLGSEEEHSLTWVSDSQWRRNDRIHPSRASGTRQGAREISSGVGYSEKPLQRHVPSDHSLTATKPEQIPEWSYKKWIRI